MEFVRVTFPTHRQVRVDGSLAGYTNDVIQLESGIHTFDLGPKKNYSPEQQRRSVSGTTPPEPMIIPFEPTSRPTWGAPTSESKVEIGPLADIEGKAVPIEQLLALKTDKGENWLFSEVDHLLRLARESPHLESHGVPIVDAAAYLRAALLEGERDGSPEPRPGEPDSSSLSLMIAS